jgi:hypothetical protein
VEHQQLPREKRANVNRVQVAEAEKIPNLRKEKDDQTPSAPQA